MKQQIGKHFFVSGKVQGVFYRDSTCKKAQELNITGSVKNLNDGRVEVFAYGDPFAIKTLENWLWEGPKAAVVEQVETLEVPFENHSGFVVL